MWQFILFRGLQGLGGGAVFPVALAVVADLYSPAERGKYLGLFGAVFGLSSLLGPGIGGFITDTWGWHWIFFVNIPLALVSLFVCWRLLPPIKRPGGRPEHRLPGRRGLHGGDRAVPDRAHRTSRPANGRIPRSAG